MIADKTFVSLVVNCGFARVGILELSRLPKGVFRTLSRKRKRAQDFQTLFSTFTFPSQYFEEDQARKTSLFDRHCEIVIRSCSKKWHPTESRAEYLETFKLSVWRSLSSSLQQKHSYSKCNECGRKYMHLQEKIPFHPCFIPSGDVLNHTTIHDESLSEKQLTQRIFSQLNGSFRERFGHNFSESAVKFCGTSENISQRISKNQKKKEKRKLQRSFRNHLNEQFRENAALSLLSEKESMGSYQRKRLLQSFEKKAEPCPKRSHIPSDENIHFDVSQICKDVESWPDSMSINWSELARKHGLTCKNGGQIIKETAQKHGIDVFRFPNQPQKRRTRVCKRRLPGNEISVPMNPTLQNIKEHITIECLIMGH